MRECVFRYSEEKERALIQFVKTGIQDDQYIQVREGLDTGKAVITAPYDAVSKELKDSSRVKEVSKEVLFEGS